MRTDLFGLLILALMSLFVTVFGTPMEAAALWTVTTIVAICYAIYNARELL